MFAIVTEGRDQDASGIELHHEVAADVGYPDVVPRLVVEPVQPMARLHRDWYGAVQIAGIALALHGGAHFGQQAAVRVEAEKRMVAAMCHLDQALPNRLRLR